MGGIDRRTGLGTALVIGSAMLALGVPGAWATTTVVYEGSPGQGAEVTMNAAPGEQNTMNVFRPTDGVWFFRDSSAGTQESSPQCQQEDPNTVRCLAQNLRRISGNAGDGDDVLAFGSPNSTLFPSLFPDIAIKAGAGADQVRAFGSPNSTLFPSLFPDIAVRAGAGNDLVNTTIVKPPAQSGATRSAGSAARKAPRQLVTGDAGKDRIKVRRGKAKIRGGDQGDLLRGGLGPQRLIGGEGDDTFHCGKGRDFVITGPGKDGFAADCERAIFDEVEDFELN